MYSVLNGDCLEEMKAIPDELVDMVFADLPYGVTHNKWDSVIPFEPLWEQMLRVGKRNCAFVFTATQPFATTLICSQLRLFRYDLVWQRGRVSGFLNAKKMPLRCHENLLIFYRALPPYNPQFTFSAPYNAGNGRSNSKNYGQQWEFKSGGISEGKRYPVSCLHVAGVNNARNVHPTQKPVALLEWLIKTYSNEGDLVLDPTMGSGTTGVACLNTNRHFIGIEKDPTYFKTAYDRLEKADGPSQE